MSHNRFDQSRLDKAERTSQGYLRVPATVTRVGVLKYRRPDGTVVRELRHPDEVFAPESLATLSNLPVTNDHPFEMLDHKNTRHHIVGTTGDQAEKKDDAFVGTHVVIMDHETISAVESGKAELSCGYNCDTDKTPGVWNGEEYDQVQRNIVYNHLSVVKKGRAGADCRLHLDHDDLIDQELKPEEGTLKEEEIKQRIDAAVGEALEKAAADHKKELEAKQEEIALAKGEVDKQREEAEKAKAAHDQHAEEQKAEADKLQARVDSLEEEKKGRTDAADPKLVAEAVKARMAIERVACKLLPVSEKFDSETSDLDLMKRVIARQSPGAKLDGQSETYIKARFDHIAEGLDTRDASVRKANEIVKGRRDGADEGSSTDARKRMIEDAKNQYKQPLSATKEK